MNEEQITNGTGKELTIGEIQKQIYHLPNRPPFMLDVDLATIYQSSTRRINDAVRRNPKRFPEDFCFRLTMDEVDQLRSQNATAISEPGDLRSQNDGAIPEVDYLRSQNVTAISRMSRNLPRGFTERGANQLSGSLKTPVADAMSVMIMRAFSAMKERLLCGHSPDSTLAFQEGFNLGYKRGIMLSELCEQHSIARVQVSEYCHYRSLGYSLPAASGQCFLREKKARAIEEAFTKVGVTFPKRFIPPKAGEIEKSLMDTLCSKVTPKPAILLDDDERGSEKIETLGDGTDMVINEVPHE